MKVKIWSRGFTDLPERNEAEINAWLEENPNITIVSQQTAVCTGTNLEGQVFINVTVTIFYKEEVR